MDARKARTVRRGRAWVRGGCKRPTEGGGEEWKNLGREGRGAYKKG
jgi:hypothetical protein